MWEAFQLSLIASALAMPGVLIGGTALGWCFARYRFYGKFWLNTLLLLPLVFPPTVTGYYLITFFGPLFNVKGVVLASGVVAFPLMFQSARAAFEKVPLALEEAASSMGQTPWQCFLKVSLPLARQGLMAGGVLSFARALGEFGATLMVAGNITGKTQTLPLAVYEALMAGQEYQAKVGVIILTLISLVVMGVATYFRAPEDSPEQDVIP
jgi:molybdate transport system permease protein